MKSNEFIVVDYSVGNTQSLVNAFERLGQAARVSSDPHDIEQAKALILPGVGSFGVAMNILREEQLIPVLNDAALKQKKPVLGICLGMQIMTDSSEESPGVTGLGWIPGKTLALQPRDNQSIPHMGWNEIEVTDDSNAILKRVHGEDYSFYFAHSFYVKCKLNYISAVSNYGHEFISAIQFNNIFGLQFHAEKSSRSGLKILKDFIRYADNN